MQFYFNQGLIVHVIIHYLAFTSVSLIFSSKIYFYAFNDVRYGLLIHY